MSFPPYPNLPAPATWADGPLLVSQLRDDMTNDVLFLANRPSFQGYCTGTPAVSGSGTLLEVGLDTEVFDTWGGHWTATYPAFYNCQAPGWHLAEGYIPYAYTSTSNATFGAAIRQSLAGGVSVWTGEQSAIASGKNPGCYTAELCQLERTAAPGVGGGDTVCLGAVQYSGSSVNLDGPSGNLVPRMSIRWVSALSGTAPLPVPPNPVWPVPPEYITAAFGNATVRDAIRFLAYPPITRYTYRAGTYSMASGSFSSGGTPVPFDTPTVDNYNAFSIGSGSYVAPVAGSYYCYGQVAFAPNTSSGSFSAGFAIGGGPTVWGKAVQSGPCSQGVCVPVCQPLRVAAGQTITLMGAQSTGSALKVAGSGDPVTKMIVVWESA